MDDDTLAEDVFDDESPAYEHSDEVDESGPEEPQLPVSDVTEQFPAVDGTEEGLHTEVAQRAVDGADEDMWHKVFRVGRIGVTEDDPIHRQNAVAVVQEAVQRGLHPRGDVYLVAIEETDEPLNASGSRRMRHTDLRYAVQVVPASIDTEPGETTTAQDIHAAE